jgi:hypothetical protein
MKYDMINIELLKSFIEFPFPFWQDFVMMTTVAQPVFDVGLTNVGNLPVFLNKDIFDNKFLLS